MLPIKLGDKILMDFKNSSGVLNGVIGVIKDKSIYISHNNPKWNGKRPDEEEATYISSKYQYGWFIWNNEFELFLKNGTITLNLDYKSSNARNY